MESLESLGKPWLLVAALLIYGFFPGAAMRVIVRLYPKGHPRRAELVAEVYAVPRWDRPFWVFQHLEMGLAEGLSARRAARHERAATQSKDEVTPVGTSRSTTWNVEEAQDATLSTVWGSATASGGSATLVSTSTLSISGVVVEVSDRPEDPSSEIPRDQR